VRFVNVSYGDFIKNTKGKSIVQFGASSLWEYYMSIFPDIVRQVVDRTLFIVDNDPGKQGAGFEIGSRKVEVKCLDALSMQQHYVILIVVNMAHQESICRQLESLEIADDIECYSLPLMIHSWFRTDHSCVDRYFAEHTKPVIPARIHSFWFSGEEKPDIYKRCIESWHKHCPGYEILEWNADNYDITKNFYMKQAYERQKWAFVSDYARLDVVHSYGGIYLDMDVELLAPMDKLRNAAAFFCRQDDGFLELGSGFGAIKGNWLVKEMLEAYEGLRLVDDLGAVDMTAQPLRLSKVLDRHGVGISHESQVLDDMIFLSNDYVVCGDMTVLQEDRETRIGIHWHNAGWLDENTRKMLKKAADARSVLLRQFFKDGDKAEAGAGSVRTD